MPSIDITPHILGRKNQAQEIRAWLSDNVGEYLGRGEDPVLEIGAGWEIRTERIATPEGTASWWVVDITDAAKATHFALSWIG
jgi:O-methyltransferase involved in polyketide biosynthesis